MQCDCKTTMEARLLEYFKGQQPDASDHKVELQGYGITFGQKMDLRAYMNVATTCSRTAKATGRVVEKKGAFPMFATYCPFCGTRAVPEET